MRFKICSLVTFFCHYKDNQNSSRGAIALTEKTYTAPTQSQESKKHLGNNALSA
jgi:hypothetical protein